MFRVLLEPVDAPPDEGFELGHVTLRHGAEARSSRDAGTAGLVMTYLAATDLLVGERPPGAAWTDLSAAMDAFRADLPVGE